MLKFVIKSNSKEYSSGFYFKIKTVKNLVYHYFIEAELISGDKSFVYIENTRGIRLVSRSNEIYSGNRNIYVFDIVGDGNVINFGMLFWNKNIDYCLNVHNFNITCNNISLLTHSNIFLHRGAIYETLSDTYEIDNTSEINNNLIVVNTLENNKSETNNNFVTDDILENNNKSETNNNLIIDHVLENNNTFEIVNKLEIDTNSTMKNMSYINNELNNIINNLNNNKTDIVLHNTTTNKDSYNYIYNLIEKTNIFINNNIDENMFNKYILDSTKESYENTNKYEWINKINITESKLSYLLNKYNINDIIFTNCIFLLINKNNNSITNSHMNIHINITDFIHIIQRNNTVYVNIFRNNKWDNEITIADNLNDYYLRIFITTNYIYIFNNNVLVYTKNIDSIDLEYLNMYNFVNTLTFGTPLLVYQQNKYYYCYNDLLLSRGVCVNTLKCIILYEITANDNLKYFNIWTNDSILFQINIRQNNLKISYYTHTQWKDKLNITTKQLQYNINIIIYSTFIFILYNTEIIHIVEYKYTDININKISDNNYNYIPNLYSYDASYVQSFYKTLSPIHHIYNNDNLQGKIEYILTENNLLNDGYINFFSNNICSKCSLIEGTFILDIINNMNWRRALVLNINLSQININIYIYQHFIIFKFDNDMFLYDIENFDIYNIYDNTLNCIPNIFCYTTKCITKFVPINNIFVNLEFTVVYDFIYESTVSIYTIHLWDNDNIIGKLKIIKNNKCFIHFYENNKWYNEISLSKLFIFNSNFKLKLAQYTNFIAIYINNDMIYSFSCNKLNINKTSTHQLKSIIFDKNNNIIKQMIDDNKDIEKQSKPIINNSNTPSHSSIVIIYHKNLLSLYKYKWIEKCISSIYNQTFQQFDIYEVNYGNRDEYFTSKFNFSNKKIILEKIDLPDHSYCMNYMINNAFNSGYNYVFNVNLDDYYHPTRFEKEIQCINNGFDLCSSLWYYIQENNNDDNITLVFTPEKLLNISTFDKYISSDVINTNLNNNHNVINHSCVCFSKSFWYRFDNFGNLLRYRNDKPYEDMTLWTRAVNGGAKIAIINDYLIYYRIHENSICGQIKHSINVSKPNKYNYNLGFLLVATGSYITYVADVINSIVKYFLPEHKKTFFIFTDKPTELKILENKNKILEDTKKIIYGDGFTDYVITTIKRTGFPGDTLYRYHYFLLQEHEILQRSDLLYYFDVDMEIVDIIKNEVIPDIREDKYFIGVRHPGFYMKEPFKNSYGSIETREESSAFVAPDMRKDIYIAGGFNGGLTQYYINMCKYITKNIDIDDSNNIIAVWHDESHLNKFMSHNYDNFNFLDASYCYPGKMNIKCNKKIVALDKNHDKVRYNESYITCNLIGGLGNQLFQMFSVISLCIDHNYTPIFNNVMLNGKTKHAQTNFRDSIFRYIRRMDIESKKWTEIKETSFTYKPISIDTNKNYIKLDGYYQSYKYFDHNKDKIINMLDIDYNTEIDNFNKIKYLFSHTNNTVGIHVRRGDYLNNVLFHYNLSNNYYKKAINEFDIDSHIFIIFSDDIEYCKQQDVFQNIKYKYFIENSDTIQSFKLLCLCDNIIMSNSTFSWWSAYLSKKKNIIVPSKWFGIKGHKNTGDLYLNNWKQISDLDDGLSFIIRAKNEEQNMHLVIQSLMPLLNDTNYNKYIELIIVDNNSTDLTYNIACEYGCDETCINNTRQQCKYNHKYKNIKVYKYPYEINRIGEYDKIHIHDYYNWCLSKATKKNIIKWDADFIAVYNNLKEMIDKFDVLHQSKKWSIWLSGYTLFNHKNKYYINPNSYYDEYRLFSLENGFRWSEGNDGTETTQGEYMDYCPETIKYIEYMFNKQKIICDDKYKLFYDKPIFYEIKRSNINEFSSRLSLIDDRDKKDKSILDNLNKNIIDESLIELSNNICINITIHNIENNKDILMILNSIATQKYNNLFINLIINTTNQTTLNIINKFKKDFNHLLLTKQTKINKYIDINIKNNDIHDNVMKKDCILINLLN